MRLHSRHFLALLAAVLAATLSNPLHADGDDPHAAHRRMAMEADFLVTRHDYSLPELSLVDQHGTRVRLPALLDGAENTVISFIFTSCAGICPMITANMTLALPAMDRIDDDYQVLLISVDPQYDTPERLAEYGRRFHTGDRIRFLTGSSDDVFEVLRSMNVLYEGSNKMNHQPVTLMTSRTADDWMRIDGLIASDVLTDQYRQFVGSQVAHH